MDINKLIQVILELNDTMVENNRLTTRNNTLLKENNKYMSENLELDREIDDIRSEGKNVIKMMTDHIKGNDDVTEEEKVKTLSIVDELEKEINQKKS